MPAAGGATAGCFLTPSSRSDGQTSWECPGSPDLNLSNRPVRTRMPGGVAGGGLKQPPPMTIFGRSRHPPPPVDLPVDLDTTVVPSHTSPHGEVSRIAARPDVRSAC